MDKAKFESAVKAAGGKIGFFNKGAYNALQGMIPDEEAIAAAGECIDGKGAGAVIVAGKNLYAAKFSGMFSSDNVTIPLEKITSFSLTGGVFSKTLNITEGTLIHAYPQITNQDGIIAAINTGRSTTAAASPALDPAAELRKYKALLDDGIITQEDFDKKKVALLGI
jgi:hypothetical protein